MKMKISKEEFIEGLLTLEESFKDLTVKFYMEAPEPVKIYKGDKRRLTAEARIFSLWLLTISIPVNRDLLDLLHDTYFRCSNISEKDIEFANEEINKRYKIYNDALKTDQKREKENQEGIAGEPMVGIAMVEIIKNQNPHFCIHEGRPTHITDFAQYPEYLSSWVQFMHYRKQIGIKITDLRNTFDIDKYFVFNNN